MRNGTPLTDTDRWDWLTTLRDAATEQLKKSNSVIVTCPSVRQKYRDVFRVASYHDPSVQLCFIYVRVYEKHLQARVKARSGHYMKESMVRSQMECLEEPALVETDVVTIDVQQDPEVVCDDALDGVRTRLHQLEKA
jgi:gluconokinase